MSQIFSADAQVNPIDIPLPVGVATLIVTTKPLQPPYGTAKAKVIALLDFLPEVTATQILVELFRNPDSENLQLSDVIVNFTAGLTEFNVTVCAVDEIPDGRSVLYALVATQLDGAANGSADAGSYIEATLISG